MRPNQDSSRNPFKRNRQVPDYTARRVQWRLAILVFAVMLVLLMMQKAGQPETWEWMNFKKQPANQTSQGHAIDYGTSEHETVDTRISLVEGDADQPTDVITVADAFANPDANDLNAQPELKQAEPNGAEAEAAAEISEANDFVVAERDFWQKMYNRLSSPDKDTLFHLLRATIYRDQLNDQLSEPWAELSARIDLQRQAYYKKVEQRITALNQESQNARSPNPDGQEQRWTETLASMRKFWDQRVNPQLTEMAAGESALDEKPDRQKIEAVIELLDIAESIALSRVEDNAMTSRKSDMQAWFGIFDRLRRATETEIADSSRGGVSYVQLFEQPELYRDQVVTIRGQVRAAWWVEAPTNVHQIERYYVYWIRPDDGSNNPIAVYALEKPAGFPEINKKHIESDQEEWKEPVTVHGVFLKKWVYLSRDSSRICPLLLAKTIQWEPVAETAPAKELPGILAILATILVVGLVAVGIAMFAYRLTSKDLPGSRLTKPDVLKFDAEQISDQS